MEGRRDGTHVEELQGAEDDSDVEVVAGQRVCDLGSTLVLSYATHS
jgi:hypothetical protein